MPPTPGILRSRSSRSRNQKDSVIQMGDKTEDGIRQELETVAMDICRKEDESFDTNESEDDDAEEDNQDNQNKGSSPVSINESLTSNTSLKENVVPSTSRKKAKAVRRLTMETDTPKNKRPKKRSASRASTRRRRYSGASTSTVASRVSKAASLKEEVDEKKEVNDKSEVENESSDDDVDGDDVFVVERIDGKQILNGVTYYFIKWKGWDESANTWEPIEHLDGCSELLEAFSKREAEKGNKRRPGPKGRRRDSDEEDEDVLSETRKNMKSYGILTEWPADKEPISVEGVITVDGALTYVVKRKARLGNRHLDRTNAILVHADGFRQYYPELVIAFYQGRVLWCDNNDQKSEDEKAAAAAQVSLLAKHRGTQIGNDITEEINNEMLMDCEVANKEYESVPLEDASEKSIPVGLDQDTQVIPTDEDEVVDINEPIGDALYDDGLSHPDLSERIISTENDKFGLPEDLEDDVSTDSEAEFEETPIQSSTTSSKPLGNIKPVSLF